MARTPIHPGEILNGELEEIGLTAKKLADVIEVPPNRSTSCWRRGSKPARLSSGSRRRRQTPQPRVPAT
jgi:hypothetical protein